MKNIQVIDGAENSVFDIFAATDADFRMIFGRGEDIAFIDEVFKRNRTKRHRLNSALARLWTRRIPKREAQGIHGLLFYGLPHRKAYYPTRRDEDAMNPDGSALR